MRHKKKQNRFDPVFYKMVQNGTKPTVIGWFCCGLWHIQICYRSACASYR
jgi:hypothetical protein